MEDGWIIAEARAYGHVLHHVLCVGAQTSPCDRDVAMRAGCPGSGGQKGGKEDA